MEPSSPNSTAAESPDPTGQAEEALIDAAADDAQARLWLRSITALLQSRPAEPDSDPKIQKALSRLWIAAADRAARILRADVVGIDRSRDSG